MVGGEGGHGQGAATIETTPRVAQEQRHAHINVHLPEAPHRQRTFLPTAIPAHTVRVPLRKRVAAFVCSTVRILYTCEPFRHSDR